MARKARPFFPWRLRNKLRRERAAAAAAEAATEAAAEAARIGLTCGTDDVRSILSTLINGWDSIDEFTHPLLCFFTTKEACTLRLLCKEFLDSVEKTPWHDMETRIGSSSDCRETLITDILELWRQCFPRAIGAKVKDNSCLLTTDFEFFVGLQSLDISWCWGYDPDEALYYLRGTICSLKISQDMFEPYYTVTFTNNALMHLPFLEELDLTDCHGITMELFPHLRGISKLSVGRVTDEWLVNFRGIKCLHLRTCRGITAAGLHHLRGIHTLIIEECPNFRYCDVCRFADQQKCLLD
jgi:hypothetical protein